MGMKINWHDAAQMTKMAATTIYEPQREKANVLNRENKDADQLRGNLCFRYSNKNISLLP